MYKRQADGFEGDMKECDEGTLEWVDKARLNELNLWEGDQIFFRLLEENRPFFSLKLEYRGDRLIRWSLDGEEKGPEREEKDSAGEKTQQVRRQKIQTERK